MQNWIIADNVVDSSRVIASDSHRETFPGKDANIHLHTAEKGNSDSILQSLKVRLSPRNWRERQPGVRTSTWIYVAVI